MMSWQAFFDVPKLSTLILRICEDPHVGPWLDVLYAGLAKLRTEAVFGMSSTKLIIMY